MSSPKTKHVLLSFVGFHDPFFIGPADSEQREGPLLSLLRGKPFDVAVVISTPNTNDRTVVDPTDDNNGFLPLEVAYALLREELLAQQTVASTDGPDVDGAEGTIAEIHSALSLVNSMKSNCTEAKKNVDNVRESIGKIESTIREKLRDLRNQLRIA